MKIQKSPNRWSCLATSFAMVLDTPLQDLIKEIGHDGSEIAFPGLPEPYQRRSFHIQEFVEPCLRRGFLLCPVEGHPMLGAMDRVIQVELPGGNQARLVRMLQSFQGVAVGNGRIGPHAVAWDRHQVYDPNGMIYADFASFTIREFWIVDWIGKSQSDLLRKTFPFK